MIPYLWIVTQKGTFFSSHKLVPSIFTFQGNRASSNLYVAHDTKVSSRLKSQE
jgi:hypothetical protein